MEMLQYYRFYNKTEQNLFALHSPAISMYLWLHIQFFCWCYCCAGLACNSNINKGIVYAATATYILARYANTEKFYCILLQQRQYIDLVMILQNFLWFQPLQSENLYKLEVKHLL